MKKVKIITRFNIAKSVGGESQEKFEDKIAKLLEQGWEIKGFANWESYSVLLVKNE